MYKIKDEIINEVCEKLNAIAKLSLEAEQLLRSGMRDTKRRGVDYDPDEYILQHLQSAKDSGEGNTEERR